MCIGVCGGIVGGEENVQLYTYYFSEISLCQSFCVCITDALLLCLAFLV